MSVWVTKSQPVRNFGCQVAFSDSGIAETPGAFSTGAGAERETGDISASGFSLSELYALQLETNAARTQTNTRARIRIHFWKRFPARTASSFPPSLIASLPSNQVFPVITGTERTGLPTIAIDTPRAPRQCLRGDCHFFCSCSP